MTHGTWRYEVVSGAHKREAWIELREQYISGDGEKRGYVSIASAPTIAELIADLRAWLAVAEAYEVQEQGT